MCHTLAQYASAWVFDVVCVRPGQPASKAHEAQRKGIEMAVKLGDLVQPKAYEVTAWIGSGANAVWTSVAVMADSFAIDSGVLKFTLRGALISAYAENAWQTVVEV